MYCEIEVHRMKGGRLAQRLPRGDQSILHSTFKEGCLTHESILEIIFRKLPKTSHIRKL